MYFFVFWLSIFFSFQFDHFILHWLIIRLDNLFGAILFGVLWLKKTFWHWFGFRFSKAKFDLIVHKALKVRGLKLKVKRLKVKERWNENLLFKKKFFLSFWSVSSFFLFDHRVFFLILSFNIALIGDLVCIFYFRGIST